MGVWVDGWTGRYAPKLLSKVGVGPEARRPFSPAHRLWCWKLIGRKEQHVWAAQSASNACMNTSRRVLDGPCLPGSSFISKIAPAQLNLFKSTCISSMIGYRTFVSIVLRRVCDKLPWAMFVLFGSEQFCIPGWKWPTVFFSNLERSPEPM